jgi:O-methyltransferase
MGRIQNLKIKALKSLSELFNAFPFFIQGRMDIDPKSLWFDKAFNIATGGFLPSKSNTGRTLTNLPFHDHVRRDMLALMCRSIEERKINGHIAELGVYQGATARLFHHYFPERKLYLFDTFQGFDPRDVEQETSKTGIKTTAAHFSDTAIDLVLKTISPQNDNIETVAGYFPESVENLQIEGSFALVHLDADLYEPTKAGLEFFYPKLTSGGILIVHDYNAWLGARQAVEEYCLAHHLVTIPMPDKSGSCILLNP